MARKEKFSIGELTITRGIRGTVSNILKSVVRAYKCTPAAKVANRYVTSVEMGNKAYTLANSGLPGDSLPHNVTLVRTVVGAGEPDTPGTILVTGTDINGVTTSDSIIPGADGATVQGLKAFKTVTSIVGSGWTINVAADTIVVGFGDLQGLPEKIVAAGNIILVAFDAAVVNAPVVTVSSAETSSNTVSAVGDATKQLKVIYEV